jgi:hypothetical protein
MGLGDWRAQRRWRREMERRLRELELEDRRLDADGHQIHRPEGAPVPLPRGHHRSRPRRERRTTGPVLPGLLVVAVIMAGVFLLDPSASGQRLRDLVGFGPEPVDGDGSYAFVVTQPGSSEPVSWNPCRPIRYVVNPDGAPPEWESLVRESTAEIADASGFRFEDTGTSEERDFDDRTDGLGRPQPVLIGWADEDEVPGLAGRVAGLGGSTYVERDRHRTYITGSVVLDAELFADLADDRGGHELMRAILVHELGHVVGLDHVDDENELMYRDNIGQTELGPGDLEGLARLGAVPCT